MIGQRGQQGLLDRELGHVGVVQPRRGKEKKREKKKSVKNRLNLRGKRKKDIIELTHEEATETMRLK